MAIDIARGLFAKNDYRYNTDQFDLSIQAQSPTARDETILTNLSAAGRDALAVEMFNDLKSVSKSFLVETDGIEHAMPAQFDGSPPTFQSIFQELTDVTGRKQRPISVLIDPNTNTTIMTLRG